MCPTLRTLLSFASIAVLAAYSATEAAQVPVDGTRVGFTPIGGFGAHSLAYSYFTGGTPVIRLPNGLTIDPYNTGVGMTLQPGGQQTPQGMGQERYQVQTAQAAQAYQSGMAMTQKGMGMADAQPRAKPVMRQGFDPKTGAARIPSGTGRRAAEMPIFDESGAVKWPDFAPNNARREAADDAIKLVRAEVKADGHASVASTVKAKEAIRAYGVPALKAVPGGSKVLAGRLREQLVRLDQSLDALAEPAPDGN